MIQKNFSRRNTRGVCRVSHTSGKHSGLESKFHDVEKFIDESGTKNQGNSGPIQDFAAVRSKPGGRFLGRELIGETNGITFGPMPTAFPAGAENYRQFLDSIRRALTPAVREPLEAAQSEMEIQARWFGGEFGRRFNGVNGERIEIVQFGHWNYSSGPDFTEAAVQIDGELKKGAIEIDLDALSWEAHGHGSSRAFDSVVLHIFLNAPDSRSLFFTRNSRHKEICQLRLTTANVDSGSPPRWLPEASPGLCVHPLGRMNDDAVGSLLRAAAEYRLFRKFSRLHSMSESTSSNQALFQGLAEALGFRQNKMSMAILSQRCPLRSLLEMKPIEREAGIFGTAGFMKNEIYNDSIRAESREYLRSLWDQWWKLRDEMEPGPDRTIRWKTGGSRPVNHPQRRVGALVAVVNQWGSLARVWRKPAFQCEKITRTFFDGLVHPYWERHFTLQSKPSSRRMRLIGRDRQRDILGNVIFPWLVGSDPHWWDAYAAMRGSGENEKLRRASLRLFGDQKKRANNQSDRYFKQQGLLQIYQDFCLEDASDCQDCPFPEQLLQWQGEKGN